MSAIPVVMEILLQKDEALASLQEFNQQAQSVVNEMRSIEPVSIDLRIDDQASYRATDIINGVRSDVVPIEIPLQLDTSSFAAQMAEVREMMAAQPPIIIPVQYVPIGGAGGAAGGAVEAGEATGVAEGGEVAGAAILGGVVAGPEGAAVAAEGAEAEMGAEVAAPELEELSDEDFGRYPMSKKGKKFADKIGNKPPWYKYSGTGHHAFILGYLGYRGLQALAHRLRPEDLDAEPDVAKQVEMERQAIESEYGGIKRWIPGDDDEYEFRMRENNSEQGLLRSDKEQQQNFKRNLGAVDQLRHRNDDLTDELSGVGGKSIREKIAKEFKDTMDEADAAINRFQGDDLAAKRGRELGQRMKETAQRIFDAQTAALNQLDQQAQSQIIGQGAAAEARASGDYKTARKIEFDHKNQETYDRLLKDKDHPDAARIFKDITLPALEHEFNQQESLRLSDDASENRYVASSSFAKAAEHRAQQLHDPVGAAQAANQEIDAHIRLLQEEAANEDNYGNKEKAKTLATQASAAATEGAAEKIKNMTDAMKEAAKQADEFKRSLDDMKEDAKDERLRADGKGWTADKNSAVQKYRDAVQEIEDNPKYTSVEKQQLEDAAGQQLSSRQYAIEKQRQKELRGIDEQTTEYVYQGWNRPRMAEESHIEFEIGEALREHTDDSQYQWKLRQEGAAQLTAFALPSQQSRWYSSAADYAKALNTGYLNQDQQASKEALEAAKELKEGVKEWRHIMEGSQNVQVIRNGY